MSQTTIEPCAFCGEPSTTRVELTPPLHEMRGGTKHLIKDAVMRWTCDQHAQAVKDDAGWQKRQAEARRQSRAKMRRGQDTLFDAAPTPGYER
jgi:hypothetical protein